MSTIGFIGVGQIGGTVARLAVEAGYSVVLSNSRGPETLAGAVAELGSSAKADTAANLAADENIKIVVLSIPLKAVPTLLPSLKLKNKIILDTSNYYPFREGQLEELDSSKITTSEYVLKYLDSSNKLVKVFNNIPSFHLKNSASSDPSKRVILPISGDDLEAKKATTEFVNKIGYDTYDAGSSSESWRFEPGTEFYGAVYLTSPPEGLSHDDLKNYYKNSKAKIFSKDEAKRLLDNAKRPDKIGGDVGSFPPVFLEVLLETIAEQEKAKAANGSKLF